MRLTKPIFSMCLGITFCFLVMFFNHGNSNIYKESTRKTSRLETTTTTFKEERQKTPDDESTTKPKNVLFMITDDMRTQLNCYAGKDFANPTLQQKMYSPNLDKLASSSLLLKRAYTQYSLCGPSRASMLTSRRPDTTRIYGNDLYWREAGGNFTTLPQYFKNHGYHTVGLGKIYHQFKSSNNQDPISWSRPHFDPPYCDGYFYDLPHAAYKAVTDEQRENVSPLTDDHAIAKAKEWLRELAQMRKRDNTPFFMALGFSKPHLNFVAPKKFFGYYPLESDEQYLSELSWQTPIVSQYCNMANSTVAEDGTKRLTDQGLRYLRQAYFACISFVDSLVGEILAELDALQLTDSTIVSFVADHGHHLGENEAWGKQTNYESATHIPMMLRVPGQTDQGVESRSLVEGVDLYPSIVEAAGLPPLPKCPDGSSNFDACTEGRSFLPLIKHPKKPTKMAAYSQVKRMYNFMEYSVRTDRYRYVAYAKASKKEMANGRDKFVVSWDVDDYWTELYDIEVDPEERVNRTANSAYVKVKDRLHTKLQKFFKDVDNVPRRSRS